MGISRASGAAALTLALLVLAVPSFAHHSFDAEFDKNNCKDFTGPLTKVDWQNPHPNVFIDVKDANGKVANWSFQMNAIPVLKRVGIDRQLFVEHFGKEIWVKGCLAKTGRENYGVALALKFSDGVLHPINGLLNEG